MRSQNLSRYFFAVVLIGLGILGLIKGDFAPGFQPVPESLPARLSLAYLAAVVCIACGGGMLFRRTEPFAVRLLFGWLLVWLIILRLPWMAVSFEVGTWWAASSTAILTASAWVLYSQTASERYGHRSGFLVDAKGMRMARVLFGLGLIPIGLAHFLYLDATAPLVPEWLMWPVFWSYFTGGAFIAAGVAVIVGVYARLAATLAAIEIGLLTVIVWLPIVVSGSPSSFQWNEFVVSILLTSCAWVVADSYRSTQTRV